MKRLGDGLVNKVLAPQARASMFNPQKPPFKNGKVGGVHLSEAQRWRGGDRQIPRTHWPASLAHLVGSSPVKDPASQTKNKHSPKQTKTQGGMAEERAWQARAHAALAGDPGL